MSFFAAVVETPKTAPSSAMQNSATSGQPSPAMGSSCSLPGIVNAAAEWIDSGGCRSAQRAASTSWSAAARSSASRRARMADSTSEGVRSSTSPASRTAAKSSIMRSILPPTTDNPLRGGNLWMTRSSAVAHSTAASRSLLGVHIYSAACAAKTSPELDWAQFTWRQP